MSGARDDVVLSLSGLTKSYGDLVAVKDLSLDVFRGEILGFLGPNGAGKTTTVNMICGLLTCDAGEITVMGRPLASDYRRCRRLMGLCPQDIVIWETLTCLEQLEFAGRLYDLGWKDARRRAEQVLEILGLRERRNTLARTLSGGMKRRLNIGLALVHDPPIVILDEPQAGLDPQSRVLVREYIRSLAATTTVLLTTHDMEEADRLSDRIAIIDRGELLVLDTSQNLKNSIGEGEMLDLTVANGTAESLERLREGLPANVGRLGVEQDTLHLVGTDLLAALPAFLERCRALGVDVEHVAIRRKTLEDVFIALTGRGLRE